MAKKTVIIVPMTEEEFTHWRKYGEENKALRAENERLCRVECCEAQEEKIKELQDTVSELQNEFTLRTAENIDLSAKYCIMKETNQKLEETISNMEKANDILRKRLKNTIEEADEKSQLIKQLFEMVMVFKEVLIND